MAVTMERALEVMRDRVGDLPAGHAIHVVPVGSHGLWSASCMDDHDMAYPGGVTVIGPDERLWVWSSGLSDDGLAIQLLDAAYASGMADRLDPEMFQRRLTELVLRRRRDVQVFLADVRAGALGPPRRPRLP